MNDKVLSIIIAVLWIGFCFWYIIWDMGSAERKLKKELLKQRQMAQPMWKGGLPQMHPPPRQLDFYERSQLALTQLQILFLAGELEKQELLNTTKMVGSMDKENLVLVEEIIKSKLG